MIGINITYLDTDGKLEDGKNVLRNVVGFKKEFWHVMTELKVELNLTRVGVQG